MSFFARHRQKNRELVKFVKYHKSNPYKPVASFFFALPPRELIGQEAERKIKGATSGGNYLEYLSPGNKNFSLVGTFGTDTVSEYERLPGVVRGAREALRYFRREFINISESAERRGRKGKEYYLRFFSELDPYKESWIVDIVDHAFKFAGEHSLIVLYNIKVEALGKSFAIEHMSDTVRNTIFRQSGLDRDIIPDSLQLINNKINLFPTKLIQIYDTISWKPRRNIGTFIRQQIKSVIEIFGKAAPIGTYINKLAGDVGAINDNFKSSLENVRGWKDILQTSEGLITASNTLGIIIEFGGDYYQAALDVNNFFTSNNTSNEYDQAQLTDPIQDETTSSTAPLETGAPVFTGSNRFEITSGTPKGTVVDTVYAVDDNNITSYTIEKTNENDPDPNAIFEINVAGQLQTKDRIESTVGTVYRFDVVVADAEGNTSRETITVTVVEELTNKDQLAEMTYSDRASAALTVHNLKENTAFLISQLNRNFPLSGNILVENQWYSATTIEEARSFNDIRSAADNLGENGLQIISIANENKDYTKEIYPLKFRRPFPIPEEEIVNNGNIVFDVDVIGNDLKLSTDSRGTLSNDLVYDDTLLNDLETVGGEENISQIIRLRLKI